MPLKKHGDNRFREDIHHVVVGSTKEEEDGAINNLLMGVVILYFDMLHPCTEHWVEGDSNTALIVAKNGSGSVLVEACVK